VDAPVGASAPDDLAGCRACHQAPPAGSSLAVLIGSCYLLWATRPVLSRHAGALVDGLPMARRLEHLGGSHRLVGSRTMSRVCAVGFVFMRVRVSGVRKATRLEMTTQFFHAWTAAGSRGGVSSARHETRPSKLWAWRRSDVRQPRLRALDLRGLGRYLWLSASGEPALRAGQASISAAISP
jgi:hypothetical protein